MEEEAKKDTTKYANYCTYFEGMHRCRPHDNTVCKGWVPSSRNNTVCMYLRKDIDNACDNVKLHYKR